MTNSEARYCIIRNTVANDLSANVTKSDNSYR